MPRYIDLDKIDEYKRKCCTTDKITRCDGNCIECYFCYLGKYEYEKVKPIEED